MGGYAQASVPVKASHRARGHMRRLSKPEVMLLSDDIYNAMVEDRHADDKEAHSAYHYEIRAKNRIIRAAGYNGYRLHPHYLEP
jgi:hypothetical protein